MRAGQVNGQLTRQVVPQVGRVLVESLPCVRVAFDDRGRSPARRDAGTTRHVRGASAGPDRGGTPSALFLATRVRMHARSRLRAFAYPPGPVRAQVVVA